MTDKNRDQVDIRHMLECIERFEQYTTDTDKERTADTALIPGQHPLS